MSTDGRPPRKVLCSIGSGPYSELLDVTAPSFERYAAVHGYDLILLRHDLAPRRPSSWSKVVLLQQLALAYDFLLWVDADAVIVDPSRDFVEELRPGRHRYLAHRLRGQVVPNCGVMGLRGGRRAERLLSRVWNSTRFIEHGWWENAALLHLLGYDHSPPVGPNRLTWDRVRTQFVDGAWNSIPLDSCTHPRIKHYPGEGLAQRRAKMVADMVGCSLMPEVVGTR
jgi:hypothetical protein